MDGLVLCLGAGSARVAVKHQVGAFPLQTLLGFGWGVFIYGFVYVFPMYWPWVSSSIWWMHRLILCLGFGRARVAVKQHDGFSPLLTLLGLGWGVFMHGFVYVFPMCWPWVLSSVGCIDGLVLCLGDLWV